MQNNLAKFSPSQHVAYIIFPLTHTCLISAQRQVRVLLHSDYVYLDLQFVLPQVPYTTVSTVLC